MTNDQKTNDIIAVKIEQKVASVRHYEETKETNRDPKESMAFGNGNNDINETG